ncbi:hypothetical protein CQ059_01260 [Brucella pseudogrignonensis]|uniref:hypothetical protein n=2 Tax=Brucella pseudogrignonensis TaxID=419475 RepID=UPI000CFD86EB|nr:hypothetical protein [Brucella pseudogrignonensis]PQZ42626.1 hypothetical protein CQ059_01260 [Brucella pseudogrignonensis]PRA42055.1 hypothetical protein CQ063_08625 [Brucella pseudogrignonensis]PRA70519.1 hypothetical protein CQ055_06375 [Brucella pseudogrignonensis]
MARTFPGIQNDDDGSEWDRVMHEAQRVAPDLMREMWMSEHKMRDMLSKLGVNDPNLAAFRADGPLLSAYMQAFAAKVGFALHYEFKQYAVPRKGRVQVRWFTSQEVVQGHIPSGLYDDLGTIEFMKQGKITSEFNFEYGAGSFHEKPNVNLYYAKVRDAFVVVAFVVDDVEYLPFPEGVLATFAPGDLKVAPVDRISDDAERLFLDLN